MVEFWENLDLGQDLSQIREPSSAKVTQMKRSEKKNLCRGNLRAQKELEAHI